MAGWGGCWSGVGACADGRCGARNGHCSLQAPAPRWLPRDLFAAVVAGNDNGGLTSLGVFGDSASAGAGVVFRLVGGRREAHSGADGIQSEWVVIGVSRACFGLRLGLGGLGAEPLKFSGDGSSFDV